MSRKFALLVNPASAGGRALEALPKVHATLDGLGARHRTVTSPSIDHAHQEALNAAAQIQKVDLAPHLRGAERGQAAAERARAAAAAG